MVEILEKKRRIAKYLKEERTLQKITRKELAIWTGVSYGSLRRFEETGDISFEGFIRIAEFLGWESYIYTMASERPRFRRYLRDMRTYYSGKKFYPD